MRILLLIVFLTVSASRLLAAVTTAQTASAQYNLAFTWSGNPTPTEYNASTNNITINSIKPNCPNDLIVAGTMITQPPESPVYSASAFWGAQTTGIGEIKACRWYAQNCSYELGYIRKLLCVLIGVTLALGMSFGWRHVL